MAKTKHDNYKLLPYSVIVTAVAGEEEALQTVFRHYSGHMTKLSIRTVYDENGEPHYRVDENLRRDLENSLAQAIVGKFRVV